MNSNASKNSPHGVCCSINGFGCRLFLVKGRRISFEVGPFPLAVYNILKHSLVLDIRALFEVFQDLGLVNKPLVSITL